MTTTTTRPETNPSGSSSDARKEDATALLHAVLGKEFVAAMHAAFLNGGDFTGVVPLLCGADASPHLAAATRAALVAACDSGPAGATYLLLAAGCVRAEDVEGVESTHVDQAGGGGDYYEKSCSSRMSPHAGNGGHKEGGLFTWPTC